jgi:hypothetical protein
MSECLSDTERFEKYFNFGDFAAYTDWKNFNHFFQYELKNKYFRAKKYQE